MVQKDKPHNERQAFIRELRAGENGGDTVCVEGAVERIVFESEETGFLVGRLAEEKKPGLTTFVGNMLAVSPGETVRLWGQWVDDAKFGRQLRVERFETVLPATASAIEKYLGSGLIEGIGPKFAKRLVDAFGVETLRVIDEEPERLRNVEGIGKKRSGQIREAWQSQKAIQSIMIFLQGHGIAVSQAVRIYKQYGNGAITVLRENPYRLAQDIAGIAFKSADDIAGRLGIEKDSPRRIEAGIAYTLQQATSEGHCYLPEKSLATRAAELLAVPEERCPTALAALAQDKAIVREGDDVFLPKLHEAETGCATLLKRLIGIPHDDVPINVPKAIDWIEKTHTITLSEEQREAVRIAVDAKVLVITGGPGTGKTTLLNGLLAMFEVKGLTMLLAAPTGRAAKRMTEATGREAKTIHRLLEFSPKHGGFTRHEGKPLDAQLVVIDETSMVDIALMHALLRALPPYARLFLVGDVDQLPSVGPGNVLMDIIASQVVPAVWLKTIFRQAAESGIVANAHRVNRGQYPEFNTTDFFFIERVDPEKARETIIELVTDRIPNKFGLDPIRDIQVLAPMHRGDAGVSRLNEELQRALNPNCEPLAGRAFGLNDKVMQLRNNYELEVYNGDVGTVIAVNDELKEAQVAYDDRIVLYTFDQLDELSLAYATTVHKAQGSEYPAVVIPLLTQHYMMLQRNVLYTAVTRAEKLVVLVGAPKALKIALGNTRITRRHSRLTERLANV